MFRPICPAILSILILLFLQGCVSSSGGMAPGAVDSLQQLKQEMINKQVTAMVDLHVHGNHFVNFDSQAAADKKQSARIGSKGLFTKKYALASGENGYIISSKI